MNKDREHMLDEALSEIIDYVKDKPGTSYYDVKAYAYANELENWIAVLKDRNARTCLSEYLRSKRRKDDVPYNNLMQDSVKQALGAQAKYDKKQPIVVPHDKEEWYEQNK